MVMLKPKAWLDLDFCGWDTFEGGCGIVLLFLLPVVEVGRREQSRAQWDSQAGKLSVFVR